MKVENMKVTISVVLLGGLIVNAVIFTGFVYTNFETLAHAKEVHDSQEKLSAQQYGEILRRMERIDKRMEIMQDFLINHRR